MIHFAKCLTTLLILLLIGVPVLAQNSEAPHVFHIRTFHTNIPEGGSIAERDSMMRDYFKKVSLNHPAILHEIHLRHWFGEDSREYVVVREYASLEAMENAQAKYAELEHAWWPNEQLKSAWYRKFNAYFPEYSDQTFIAIPGLTKALTEQGDVNGAVYNLQTWYISDDQKIDPDTRDSLAIDYLNKVTMKNPLILSEHHMINTMEGNDAYILLRAYAGMDQIIPAYEKFDKLVEDAYPDQSHRDALNEAFETHFTHHSDRLYSPVPGLRK